MSALALAFNLLFVLGISLTSIYHFDRREAEPKGATFISIATVSAAAINTLIWWSQNSVTTIGMVVAIGLTAFATALFLVTAAETRGYGLLRAFSSRSPPEVLQKGIYGYVRHPFYLAYMVYWLSWCALNNFHAASVICAAVISATYIAAARAEERVLNAHFGQTYTDYASRTKQFIPWIV